MTQQVQTETQSAQVPGAWQSIAPLLSNVYSCQSALPVVVAAEEEVLRSIVACEGALDPYQKAHLMHASIRAEPKSGMVCTLHPALETFAVKLSSYPASLSRDDIECLMEAGLGHSALVEAVNALAAGHFCLTLAKASGIDLREDSADAPFESTHAEHSPRGPTEPPYVDMPSIEPHHLKRSYSILREQYGFVPSLFRIQSYLPEFVNAQVNLLDSVLFAEEHLSRVLKELIVLRLAALNLNTYLVTMQFNILALLGIASEVCDQMIDNLDRAAVSEPDRALIEEMGHLSPLSRSSKKRFDRNRLREAGFSEPQIVEATGTAAFTNFLATVQVGLNPAFDFPPRRVFTRKDLYLLNDPARPTFDDHIDDPDLHLVAEVKDGNTEMFAELMRRHTRRVFGTLAGMLGNMDDARDSTQDVFLKAFQNIDNFQGRSKFSTWIMSIAVNTGIELIRQRRPTESLDDTDDESCFRPRQVQSWVQDPEQRLAKKQTNDLVRRGVLRLPEKYRIALVLRDINQVPTEDAAAALGLSVPALKARILRGRLMLRESLAPHFSRPAGETDV